ncbi:MAG: 4-hydroxy-3-methylbut-2-en-1-yl diphosphate synthase [Bacteroidetes bacterium GWF2_38_335]|nr:MAG: 4-hydroxy-3-methylbut-2-en-1-yl diphosphate synthase [Bacteroidetes bacterium GWF2_38_335]HBS85815.1 4-hydroxy-3-methylbut-2-en-1-yl diphosphate synthase [Bacteroidales bacterium]
MTATRKSTEIKIGDVPLGSSNPIRLQSMTNTPTGDVKATVAQSIRIFDAGADYVRISVPTMKDCESLALIKKELHKSGYGKPLIADIHFNPEIALEAARIVEKIRINPGNYTEKRVLKKAISDSEYNLEIEKIHERILPLLKVCREYGTVIRIGSNHGSLSGRIVERYGNTAAGMVEAAMEFVRICEREGFYNLVLSMKASSVNTMTEAGIMLQKAMEQSRYVYPQHLGVTEAGEGADGRIRSAAGISCLLAAGIGDTIRVSLSEPPENEIPVAAKILEYSKQLKVPAETNYLLVNKPFIISNQSGKPELLDPETDYLLESTSPGFRKMKKDDFLKQKGLLKKEYFEDNLTDFQIKAACELSNDLRNQKVEAFLVSNKNFSPLEVDRTILGILQALKIRISGTEFISCPTCSRSGYDVGALTRQIKARLPQAKGLKIAVMGCVVNGPGEMAGADYGFVGSKPGKVNLYKGSEEVLKNLNIMEAIDKLVEIIERDMEH